MKHPVITDGPRSKFDEETDSIVLTNLLTVKMPGRSLNLALNKNFVQSGDWTELIAVAVLDTVQNTLKKGGQVRAALKEVHKKDTDAAFTVTPSLASPCGRPSLTAWLALCSRSVCWCC